MMQSSHSLDRNHSGRKAPRSKSRFADSDQPSNNLNSISPNLTALLLRYTIPTNQHAALLAALDKAVRKDVDVDGEGVGAPSFVTLESVSNPFHDVESAVRSPEGFSSPAKQDHRMKRKARAQSATRSAGSLHSVELASSCASSSSLGSSLSVESGKSTNVRPPLSKQQIDALRGVLVNFGVPTGISEIVVDDLFDFGLFEGHAKPQGDDGSPASPTPPRRKPSSRSKRSKQKGFCFWQVRQLLPCANEGAPQPAQKCADPKSAFKSAGAQTRLAVCFGVAVCLAAAAVIGSVAMARHHQNGHSVASKNDGGAFAPVDANTSGGSSSSANGNSNNVDGGSDDELGDGGDDGDGGSGPFLKTKGAPSSPYKNATHPLRPLYERWGVAEALSPFPTGAWFTNVFLDNGEAPITCPPYDFRVGSAGLAVSYSSDRRNTAEPDRVYDEFSADITFSTSTSTSSAAAAAAELTPSLVAYDSLSATFQYSVSSSSQGGTGGGGVVMTAPLVKGSPYVTVEYSSSAAGGSGDGSWSAVLTTASSFTKATPLSLEEAAAAAAASGDDGDDGGSSPLCSANPGCASLGLAGDCCPPSPGGTALGCCGEGAGAGGGGDDSEGVALNQATRALFLELASGQRWAVFASEPSLDVIWSAQAVSFTLPAGGRLVLRLAVVPLAGGGEPSLIAHRGAYPTAGHVSWTTTADDDDDPAALSESDVATVEFQWDTAPLYTDDADGSPAFELAMMPLPHHLDAMALRQGLQKSGDVPMVSSVSSSSSSGGTLAAVEAATPRFACMKGAKLGLVAGSSWHLDFKLEPLTWNALSGTLDDTLHTHTGSAHGSRDAIRTQARADLHEHTPEFLAESSYTFGKQASRLARLALVSAQLEDELTSSEAVARLTSELDPWLLGSNRNSLVYDLTWGGLVTTDGVASQGADYGMGWYNDHHFHFGYLVYAAAAVAHFDPSFFSRSSVNGTNRRSGVLAMALDICNPPPSGAPPAWSSASAPSSPFFPVTRMKDWFDGHSWASGLFPMNNGKSQESVSEAANAYYACALLGGALQATDELDAREELDSTTAAAAAAAAAATDADVATVDEGGAAAATAGNPTTREATESISDPADPEEVLATSDAEVVILGGDPARLKATARLLFAMEVSAAKRYWQVSLHEGDEVYPPTFVAANRMVGIVGGGDVVARTWFGAEIEYVHCINMLPFTPATSHLLGKEFVAEEFPSIQGRANTAQEAWRGFIFQDQAVIDPLEAWENLVGLYGTEIDGTATGAQVDDGTSLAVMLYWTATRPPVL